MKLAVGPHEILFRFGRNRALQGYHIVLVSQAVDDAGAPILKPNGEVMLESFSEPMPLQRAIALGLDLKDISDIADAATQAALTAMDDARGAEAEAVARAEGLIRDLAEMRQTCDGLQAQIHGLETAKEKEIETLQATISKLEDRLRIAEAKREAQAGS